MKIKHIYTPLILLIFTFSGLCGITATADAQEVHALLIILGNDREIRDGVEKNEDLVVKMLKQLSDDCTVKLTVMKSKNGYQGEISRITYINQNSSERKTTQQDIIESRQVAEWLANLRPRPEDTVLVYYCGHGEIDAFGTHELLFDPGVNADTPDRAKLSQQLKEKRARLRMLITDTCSSPSRDLPESALKPLAGVRGRKRQNYPSDLFLKHEGFLDITAASPGQFAIVHDSFGGHFTIALLSHGFTDAADTNKDDFISWQETFEKTKAQTKVLYGQAEFDGEIAAKLRKNRQTTQEPYAHHEFPRALPTETLTVPGGDSVPPKRPDTTASVTILNFTSVPSEADVSINGFIVGQTPLTDYELETDGQITKEIEVTVTKEGYSDIKKEFRVQRGKPFKYPFKLTKKEIPRTFTSRDGAEMVLIPAGEFQMGSNDGDGDEKPVHTVYVDAFYMDKYEVTIGQYKTFVRATEHRDLPDWVSEYSPTDQHPVVGVSWYDAMAYAEWAGKRLPTEAEWEKAARGGLKSQEHLWGNTINASQANYAGNVGATTRVGQYAPSGYDLHDMAGNVYEWCLDNYGPNFYRVSPERNPVSGGSITSITGNYTNVTSSRVLRGGSWNSSWRFVRVASRFKATPASMNTVNGFRCVRTVSP